MADPIWDDPKVAKLSNRRPGSDKALVLRPAPLPDPSAIPPREWLYGTQLLRGFVSVLVAPGGTGKSAYAMAVAVSVAIGKPLLGDHVFAHLNVALLNLEEPLNELNRRLAAVCIRHRIGKADLQDRLFLHSGEDRPITMAEVAADGFQVAHPDEAALIAEIKAHEIGLLIVDPFAESHTLEENSNPHMVAAAAAWRRIASATNCAILLIHHVRKGAVTDIDAARGAKGLTDSARVGLLLSPMSEEEADKMGVEAEQRWQYVRLDDAKVNMSPKAGAAKWFRLEQVELRNKTVSYPNGDKVAAVTSWQPSTPLSQQDPTDLNRVLDIIADGPGPETLYSANRRGGSQRWAGHVITEILGMSEKQAETVLATWLKSGLLVQTDYRDPAARRPMRGVRVENTKRPSV
jgi:hypothetical protein